MSSSVFHMIMTSPPSPGDGHNSSASPDMMMMMKTYFHFDYHAQILFRDWYCRSPGTYALSLAAIFILALFHEWFAALKHQTLQLRDGPAGSELGPASPLPKYGGVHGRLDSLLQSRNMQATLITILHVLSALTGYLLMLVVMSYNVGMLLSVLGGIAVGFALFRVHQLV